MGRQYSQSIYVNELLVKMVQHVSLVIFSLVRQGGGGCKGNRKHGWPSTNSTQYFTEAIGSACTD